MARLSGALCMVLVTSSLLLMVLLAAGPASAYGPPMDYGCYHKMKKCLRRACKCGWPVDWAATQCGYTDLLAKSSEGPVEYDTPEEKLDPKGCPYGSVPSSAQVLHLPNMCRMVERSALSLVKAASLKSGDSHEHTYEFNHEGCQEYLADVCYIGDLYDHGYTTVPFSMASRARAHTSCRNCKAIAKMLARLICSPEHCFCGPKGEYTKPNTGEVNKIISLQLNGFSPVVPTYYFNTGSEGTYTEEHMGCHCMEHQPDCEHDDLVTKASAAAADVAAGK